MTHSPLFVFGNHPVTELCKSHPELITSARTTVETCDSIRELFHKYKIKVAVHTVSQGELDKVTEDATHQGVVVGISSFPYTELSEVITSRKTLVLLDGIQDPQNVGAIIRSSAAFGAGAVLLPSHNQSLITGGVIKASVGTAFSIPVCQIGNVAQTIEQLKEHRYWIAGLAGDGETSLQTLDTTDPLVVIVGNEGKGMRQETRKNCDFVVSIPIDPQIESLNASVSVAVTLWEIARTQQVQQ
jgi:23S rRNA (guanosine2251-2'-O)-methyltransferase